MTETGVMRAPFSYFGGKLRAAETIWAHLGVDLDSYIEPFAGSAAVFFQQPTMTKRRVFETLGDADGLIVNVWRAIRHHPNDVADLLDREPYAELELHARSMWLANSEERIERMLVDVDWCDPKAAAWTIYCQCAAIGGNWRQGYGPWHVTDGELRSTSRSGVKRTKPQVKRQGVFAWTAPPAHQWFEALADRLHRTVILQGDWRRTISNSYMTDGVCGVFLDPPYGTGDHRLYADRTNGSDVMEDVLDWIWGLPNNPNLRVVLAAGADAELPAGWVGLVRSERGSRGSNTRHQERLWFSPTCIDITRDNRN